MATYNVSNATDIVNYVNNIATSGDTVNIAAGTYTLSAKLVPDVGVSVLGAGQNDTIIYWSSSFTFSSNGWTGYKDWNGVMFQYGDVNLPDGSDAGSRQNANGAIIGDMTIVGGTGTRGQAGYNWKQMYGGIIFRAVSNFTMRNMNIYDFYNVGLRLCNIGNFTITNFRIEESSWGDGSSYRLASCIYTGIENGTISYGSFKESYTAYVNGYETAGGGGMTSKESETDYNPNGAEGGPHDPNFYIKNVDIEYCDFTEIHDFSDWGPGTGNLDLEIHNCYATGVNIRYNTFRNTLSLVQRDGRLTPESGNYAIKVYGNNWNGGKPRSFPIENIYPRMEFYENSIRGGNSGPIFARFESWDSDAAGTTYTSIHDNYIYDISPSSYGGDGLVYYNPGGGGGRLNVTNVWIFNNTVDVSNTPNWSILRMGNNQNISDNTIENMYVWNNIFTNLGSNPSVANNGQGYLNQATLENNLVFNGDFYALMGSGNGIGSINNGASTGNPEGNNFNGPDPAFQGGGTVPDRYYLSSGSFAINKGSSRNQFGVPSISLDGKSIIDSPDLGAHELGAGASTCSPSLNIVDVSPCAGTGYSVIATMTTTDAPINDQIRFTILPDNITKTLAGPLTSGTQSTTVSFNPADGLLGDNGNKTITATFVSDGTCSANASYTAPDCGVQYDADDISINCTNQEVTWTNDGITTASTGTLYVKPNFFPTWDTPEVENITIGANTSTQSVSVSGMQTNPGSGFAGSISGAYLYRLQVGDYVSPVVSCIYFNPTTISCGTTTASSVQLDWTYETYPTDMKYHSFALEQSTDGGQNWTAVTTVAGVDNQTAYSHNVTGLSAGSSYQFRIVNTFSATIDSVTYTDSDNSNVVTCTTTGTTAPYVPTNVTVDCGQNELTWTNTGENRFLEQIQIRAAVNGRAYQLYDVSLIGQPNTNSLYALQGMLSAPPTYGGLQPGAYEFQLYHNSTEYNATGGPCIFFKQIELTVSSTTVDTVNLAWSHDTYPGDEDLFQFVIEQSIDQGQNWTSVTTVAGVDSQTDYTHSVTSLNANTTYYYRITVQLISPLTSGTVSQTSAKTQQATVYSADSPSITCNGPTISSINEMGQLCFTNNGDGTVETLTAEYRINQDASWTQFTSFTGGADTTQTCINSTPLELLNSIPTYRPGRYRQRVLWNSGDNITDEVECILFNTVTVTCDGVTNNSATVSVAHSVKPGDEGLWEYEIYRDGTLVMTVPHAVSGSITYTDLDRAASTTYAYTAKAKFIPTGDLSPLSASVNCTTTANPCSFSISSLSTTACDNGTYSLNITCSGTYGPTSNISFDLKSNTYNFTSTAASFTDETFTVSGLTCDDLSNVSVIGYFTNKIDCASGSLTYDEPSSPACGITIGGLTTTNCENGLFALTVPVTYENMTAGEQIQLILSTPLSISQLFTVDGSGSEEFQITSLNCSTPNTVTVTARKSNDFNCVDTETFVSPELSFYWDSVSSNC